MTYETVEEILQWLMIVNKFMNTAIFQSNECKESKVTSQKNMRDYFKALNRIMHFQMKFYESNCLIALDVYNLLFYSSFRY